MSKNTRNVRKLADHITVWAEGQRRLNPNRKSVPKNEQGFRVLASALTAWATAQETAERQERQQKKAAKQVAALR